MFWNPHLYTTNKLHVYEEIYVYIYFFFWRLVKLMHGKGAIVSLLFIVLYSGLSTVTCRLYLLTLSQTTNFGLFETEKLSRRRFQI